MVSWLSRARHPESTNDTLPWQDTWPEYKNRPEYTMTWLRLILRTQLQMIWVFLLSMAIVLAIGCTYSCNGGTPTDIGIGKSGGCPPTLKFSCAWQDAVWSFVDTRTDNRTTNRPLSSIFPLTITRAHVMTTTKARLSVPLTSHNAKPIWEVQNITFTQIVCRIRCAGSKCIVCLKVNFEFP